MPLHDWTDGRGWVGVRTFWLVEMVRYFKPRLPDGYRVHIRRPPPSVISVPADPIDGTEEEATPALHVEREGQLVAAVELISPDNKDRRIACLNSLTRYAGYLMEGVNLVLVDVHRTPLAFSFADEIAREVEMNEPSLPTPLAVSYRVGEPAATGGRFLALWRRPLVVGELLPTLPLALSVQAAVMVDLESTYQRAAADAYLA